VEERGSKREKEGGGKKNKVGVGGRKEPALVGKKGSDLLDSDSFGKKKREGTPATSRRHDSGRSW